jgi:hypothetical protein
MTCALGLAWITAAGAETSSPILPEQRHADPITIFTPDLSAKFSPSVRPLPVAVMMNNKAMPLPRRDRYWNPTKNITLDAKIYNPITIPLW